jgi:hypothetical protein
MSLIQIGLVDQTGKISPSLMRSAAAALNIQVARDLPQFWNIRATVMFVPDPNDIPAGVWPIFLVKQLPRNEGGFHQDRHNQPFAKVVANPDSAAWTIDASHETIEMVIDPHGNRLRTATSIEIVKGKIQDGTSQFGYLVEACDPCQGSRYSYAIQGIALSDFITPHFYNSITTPGTRYSFTGAVKGPRQVLLDGYISWLNHETNEMQQLRYFKKPAIHTFTSLHGSSLRVSIDGQMRRFMAIEGILADTGKVNIALMKRCDAKRKTLESIAKVRALLYK